nr:uncharacterized protein LOC102395637 isoform X2 [Bubalus bubalis]
MALLRTSLGLGDPWPAGTSNHVRGRLSGDVHSGLAGVRRPVAASWRPLAVGLQQLSRRRRARRPRARPAEGSGPAVRSRQEAGPISLPVRPLKDAPMRPAARSLARSTPGHGRQSPGPRPTDHGPTRWATRPGCAAWRCPRPRAWPRVLKPSSSFSDKTEACTQPSLLSPWVDLHTSWNRRWEPRRPAHDHGVACVTSEVSGRAAEQQRPPRVCLQGCASGSLPREEEGAAGRLLIRALQTLRAFQGTGGTRQATGEQRRSREAPRPPSWEEQRRWALHEEPSRGRRVQAADLLSSYQGSR